MKLPGLSRSCISCCLLLISFCVTEIHSFSLHQTPVTIQELLKKEIEISCTIKEENIDTLRLYWCRETNKKGDLEFIVSATTSLERYSYGSNFSQSRFLMRRDKFQNYITLKIRNLELSDNGVYYCVAEKASKVTFGDGTKLSVVESLPTTVKPTSKKPPCKCKKRDKSKPKTPDLNCSVVIWAPLVGFAVILLIGLYFLVSHTYRVYQRTHMYFRKHSPK